MTHSPKVVQLNAQEGAFARRGTTLPPILHSVRQQSKKQLNALMEELFNNADDALFEMADRSRTDTDQHMYFDSMRELRLHRGRILTEFVERLYQSFEELYLDGANNAETDKAEANAESMSLLKNDDLELSVAIAGIVSKVSNKFSLQVLQLTQRMDTICPARSVGDLNNPLGPHRLANAFADATRAVDIDIKVRIILLKLFERFVMERLGACYELCNRMMAEAGVLTELKTVARRAPAADKPHPDSAGPRRSGAAASTEPGQEAAGPLPPGATAAAGAAGAEFSILQDLLSLVRGGASGAAGSPLETTSFGPCNYGSGSETGYSTPALMTLLSTVQTEAGSQPFEINQLPQAINLGQVLVRRAETVTGERFTGLGRADEDTVNVVGMLFDYILNDRNLAIPMKALIGRLQIPMLKVAILDKSFFNKSSHPARQLLNELSSAGIGWSGSSELKRDALYNKIESVVLRVLNQFDDDLGLFESLVAELRGYVRQDDQRAEKVLQRVKATETGKAKTVAAKKTVEQLINRKASGLRLPNQVSRFISTTWSRILIYLSVRFGPERTEWNDAVQALDDLLWAVQPLEAGADIERRERSAPDLLNRIEAGLAWLKLPAHEIDEAIAGLRTTLAEATAYDRSFLSDADASAPAPASSRVSMEKSRVIMEEIVLTAPGEAADEQDNAEPEPEMVALINRVTEGVWVEIAEDGEKTRCKVAAIIQPGNKYIFVNRRGMKVKELSRMALAVELKRKTLTILDDSQVFDRALEAVIGNLRQMHRQAPR